MTGTDNTTPVNDNVALSVDEQTGVDATAPAQTNPEPSVIGPDGIQSTDASIGAVASAPQTRGIRVVIEDIEKWSEDLINVLEQSKGVQTIARDAHATLTYLEAEYALAHQAFTAKIQEAKAEIEKAL